MYRKFHWPLRCHPIIENAGRFPFGDRGFERNYLSEHHHAIHLYEYSGLLRLDGDEHALTPGCVSITPRDRNAQYHLQGHGYHCCVHFRDDLVSDDKRIDIPIFFDLGYRKEEAKLRFMEIAGRLTYARSSEVDRERVALAFQSLMLWLSSANRSAESDGVPNMKRCIEKAVEIIEADPTASISIPELARRTKTSQNYLAKLFQRHFGSTIKEYLLNRRLEYAKTLLEISDLQIKQVAERVGIHDANYFNKIFKRSCGVTPLHYRSAIRSNISRCST
ncbi:MAG: helix-turn-helix transcriptional regulator [Kiritimatiellaeota bacterium]|nr:helix-turn-helix transcriptional regulator [Kiritimatiellota bacterium]